MCHILDICQGFIPMTTYIALIQLNLQCIYVSYHLALWERTVVSDAIGSAHQ
jgi:hypothetical protein